MAIALYARKSIERENSISCETQLEYCKSVIKPEERSEKTVEFVDNGYSGGNVDRDGFQKMMREVEKGKISKIIVYRLDRISRSLSDFVNILNTLKEHNVEFISSQESFDTSSPYGEMIVKILMIFAEFERKSIIERVTQAYAHRSEMGFYMGGRRTYGFRLVPETIHGIKTKKFEPVPEEIEQIKYIFESYAVPNITLGRLLKNLVENDINPTENGKWTTAKLSAILKNPVYVKADSKVYDYFEARNANIINPPEEFDGVFGIQLYGKTKHNYESSDWSDIKAVLMKHEGVIESDIWLKCQRKLDKNKQIRNAVSNKTSWLGGKVICEKCGRTMTTVKGKIGGGDIRIYFNCTGKSHTRRCSGTKVTVYAENLEETVYSEIGKKLTELKCTVKEKDNAKSTAINEIRNKIKAIELDEKKLADLILSGSVNSDLTEILNTRASRLKAEKQAFYEKIAEIEEGGMNKKTAINLSKKWKNASFEEKRGVCGVLINRIVISENGDITIEWNV